MQRTRAVWLIHVERVAPWVALPEAAAQKGSRLSTSDC
jgi:hypothetical protein